ALRVGSAQATHPGEPLPAPCGLPKEGSDVLQRPVPAGDAEFKIRIRQELGHYGRRSGRRRRRRRSATELNIKQRVQLDAVDGSPRLQVRSVIEGNTDQRHGDTAQIGISAGPAREPSLKLRPDIPELGVEAAGSVRIALLAWHALRIGNLGDEAGAGFQPVRPWTARCIREGIIRDDKVVVSVVLVFEEDQAATDLVDNLFFGQPELVVAMGNVVLQFRKVVEATDGDRDDGIELDVGRIRVRSNLHKPSLRSPTDSECCGLNCDDESDGDNELKPPGKLPIPRPECPCPRSACRPWPMLHEQPSSAAPSRERGAVTNIDEVSRYVGVLPGSWPEVYKKNASRTIPRSDRRPSLHTSHTSLPCRRPLGGQSEECVKRQDCSPLGC